MTKLSFANVQQWPMAVQWLDGVKANVLRSGKYMEVVESLNGIGPAELH